MNGFILLAQAGGGGQVQEIARTFGVDWAHLIAQIISFGIVCVLLHRYAYRPVLAMLEARREEIAEGLANAEKIKAELARTEAQRQEVMTQANAQATKLIEEARAAAARVQATGDPKSHRRRRADYGQGPRGSRGRGPRCACWPSCKREVGRLVVQTTAAVTGKVLTPEDQRRLAEETAKVVAA